jgi:hypothetical protein
LSRFVLGAHLTPPGTWIKTLSKSKVEQIELSGGGRSE